MTLIDHVTLRTTHLAETRQFFIEMFELHEGTRPPEIQRIPGHWLYAGDEPIVHLIGSYNDGFVQDGEIIDHVAFRLEDFDAFMARLLSRQQPYSIMELRGLNEFRVFLRAPGGQLIETVFRGAAAERAFALADSGRMPA